MTGKRSQIIAIALLVVAALACSTSTAPQATPVVLVVTATQLPPTATQPSATAMLPPPATATTTATSKPPTVTNTSVPPSATLTNTPIPPSATPTNTPVTPSPTPTPTPKISLPPGGIVIPPGGLKLLPLTKQVLNQVSVAGNATGHAVATCPSNSIVTGGGYAANNDLYVYNSSRSGNGWQAYAKNNSASGQLLNAYAICLSNISGTSAQVFDQVSAAGSAIGHAVATCPTGSVVSGGGFATSSDKSLFVYNSSRSGNGWQVYAKNTKSTSQLVNAYAVCLSGTNGTSEQVLNQVSTAGGSNGHAVAACASGSLVTGGGFAGNTDLSVYNTSMGDSNKWETYARNTSGSNQLLNSYAICVKFP